MRVSRATVCAAAMAAVLLVVSHQAMAQNGPPPTPRANATPVAIHNYIAYQITQFDAGAIAAQQSARDAIIAAASPTGAAAAYYSSFNTVLNVDLGGVLSSPQASIRDKICAGFVCWKVAGLAPAKGAAFQLEQLDRQLLADPAPAVQAYGLKAAGPILDSMTSNPAPPPIGALAGAIINTVKLDSPASMVDDAWNSLNYVQATSKLQIVPYAQQFLQLRTSQYANGSPTAPKSDSIGVLILCGTWSNQNLKSRTASMQAISDLVAVTGQRVNSKAVTDLGGYAKMYDQIYQTMSTDIPAAASLVAPFKNMVMQPSRQPLHDAAAQVSGGLIPGSNDPAAGWSPLNPAPPVADLPAPVAGGNP